MLATNQQGTPSAGHIYVSYNGPPRYLILSMRANCLTGDAADKGEVTMKFKGTIHELQAILTELGIPGHWHDEGIFYLFHSDDGVTLNWWPATGVISFQGPPGKKKRFKGLLEEKMGVQSLEIDADLQLVINSWSALPDAIRTSILTIINAVHSGKTNGNQ